MFQGLMFLAKASHLVRRGLVANVLLSLGRLIFGIVRDFKEKILIFF